MFTKLFAVMMVACVAALSLEVVFGVHLGIQHWMHRTLGMAHFSFLQL